MRSRPASAATARAFSLAIQPDLGPVQAARQLADRSTPRALEEAIAYLQPSLFGDDDRVVDAALDLLLRALAASTAPQAPRWPLSPPAASVAA